MRRGSRTAELVCGIRAIESARPAAERRLHDPQAAWFLGPAERALVGVAARAVVPIARASRGLYDDVVERHAAMDDALRRALDAGAGRLVVLGAGYDSRAWRFSRPAFEVVELDLLATLARKEACIRRHPGRFPEARVRRAAVDFSRPADDAASWADAIPPSDARTIVIWEGVSMYLEPEHVQASLRTLAERLPRAEVVLDVWTGSDDALTRAGQRVLAVWGEPLRFGLAAPEREAFFGAAGYAIERVHELGAAPTRVARTGSHLTVLELRAR